MIRAYLVGFVCLATAAVAAEKAPPAETLFDGAVTFGAYGAPVVRVGQFNGEVAAFAGAQGGLILNHSLVLGVGGWALIPSVDVADGVPRRVDFGYGGFLVEYVYPWQKLLHFHASFLVGGGGLTYSDLHAWEYNYVDAVFVAEPAVGVELNVAKYLRLAVGAGYRYAADTEFEGLTDDDLRGVSGAAVFKIGVF